jgi:phospholipase/lecithinase/hemolysin
MERATLSTEGEGFASSREDASVFYFSSFDLFDKVIDNPLDYGFTSAERKKYGPEMWADSTHPTSKMHDILAKGIAEFLKSCNPSE